MVVQRHFAVSTRQSKRLSKQLWHSIYARDRKSTFSIARARVSHKIENPLPDHLHRDWYLEQFLTVRVEFGNDIGYPDSSPLRKCHFIIREGRHARPMRLIWRPQYSENTENFIDFRVAGEEGRSIGHFGKNAAYGPHVDCRGILS